MPMDGKHLYSEGGGIYCVWIGMTAIMCCRSRNNTTIVCVRSPVRTAPGGGGGGGGSSALRWYFTQLWKGLGQPLKLDPSTLIFFQDFNPACWNLIKISVLVRAKTFWRKTFNIYFILLYIHKCIFGGLECADHYFAYSCRLFLFPMRDSHWIISTNHRKGIMRCDPLRIFKSNTTKWTENILHILFLHVTTQSYSKF
jgi:hypothetical protein